LDKEVDDKKTTELGTVETSTSEICKYCHVIIGYTVFSPIRAHSLIRAHPLFS
jgi:hypothetical protein